MKYNILTVCNEDYAPFIKLFVNSMFELIDISNVEKVFIFNTGLSQETINYLNSFPKIDIVKTDIHAGSSKIHDEGWKKNTYSKTKFLLETLEKTKFPTLMIDSDCIFVEDFEDLLDFQKDFSVCVRDRQGFSRYIGSFFAALNVEKSIDFLKKWIVNIDVLQRTTKMKHCESPALVKTVDETDFQVLEIEEQIISAVFPDDSSKIIHLKSDYYAMTIEQRLNLKHAQPFVRRYL